MSVALAPEHPRAAELGRAAARLRDASRQIVEVAGCLRGIAALPPSHHAAARAHTLRTAAREILATLGVEVSVLGHRPVGQALLVANHLSWLDPLLVLRDVPALTLAKREVGRWPILGSQVRRLGVVSVDRRDAHTRAVALRKVRRALAAGETVLNFPEGTTTYGAMAPFHRGLFGVAVAFAIPVVPVRIAYEARDACWVGDEAFLPHFLRLVRRPITRAAVHFGAPLLPRPGEEAQDLADRVRARLSPS